MCVFCKDRLPEPPPERHHASVLIRNNEGKFLTMYHITRKYWHTPGGKIENNEPAIIAAVRELKEEIGIEATGLQLVGTIVHEAKGDAGNVWVGHYFELLSHTGEVQNLEPAKCREIIWCTPDELSALGAVPEDDLARRINVEYGQFS